MKLRFCKFKSCTWDFCMCIFCQGFSCSLLYAWFKYADLLHSWNPDFECTNVWFINLFKNIIADFFLHQVSGCCWDSSILCFIWAPYQSGFQLYPDTSHDTFSVACFPLCFLSTSPHKLVEVKDWWGQVEADGNTFWSIHLKHLCRFVYFSDFHLLPHPYLLWN